MLVIFNCLLIWFSVKESYFSFQDGLRIPLSFVPVLPGCSGEKCC